MEQTELEVHQSLGSVAYQHPCEQANVVSNADVEGLNTDESVIWHINVRTSAPDSDAAGCKQERYPCNFGRSEEHVDRRWLEEFITLVRHMVAHKRCLH